MSHLFMGSGLSSNITLLKTAEGRPLRMTILVTALTTKHREVSLPICPLPHFHPDFNSSLSFPRNLFSNISGISLSGATILSQLRPLLCLVRAGGDSLEVCPSLGHPGGSLEASHYDRLILYLHQDIFPSLKLLVPLLLEISSRAP